MGVRDEGGKEGGEQGLEEAEGEGEEGVYGVTEARKGGASGRMLRRPPLSFAPNLRRLIPADIVQAQCFQGFRRSMPCGFPPPESTPEKKLKKVEFPACNTNGGVIYYVPLTPRGVDKQGQGQPKGQQQ